MLINKNQEMFGDIKYDKIILLTKKPNDNVGLTKVEYENCYGKIEGNFLLIKIFNGFENSKTFTIRVHELSTINAMKTE